MKYMSKNKPNFKYFQRKQKESELDSQLLLAKLVLKQSKENLECESLIRQLSELRNDPTTKCTHYDRNGNYCWKYIGQDPGSGKSEHACSICGEND
jgi:type II secretory pathway pseudopilin PulG